MNHVSGGYLNLYGMTTIFALHSSHCVCLMSLLCDFGFSSCDKKRPEYYVLDLVIPANHSYYIPPRYVAALVRSKLVENH